MPIHEFYMSCIHIIITHSCALLYSSSADGSGDGDVELVVVVGDWQAVVGGGAWVRKKETQK